MDIVKLLMDALGGDFAGKLGSYLGLSPDLSKKAVGAAVPALLAGLMGKSSTPQGAAALDHAVASADPGILGNLGSMFGASADQTAQRGGGMLKDMFGDSSFGSLAGVLGKFLNLQGGGTMKLLGLLAPLVMGALAKAKASTGMNPARLLSANKESIINAMPDGLSDMMRTVPGFGDVPPQQHYSAPRNVPASEPSAGIGKWLLPLVGLACLALVLFFVFNRPTSTPPAVTVPPVPRANIELNAPDMKLTSVATVTDDLNSTFTSITDALSDVTGATDVDATLTKLQDASTQLDSIKAVADKLPAEGKSVIKSLIGGHLASLRELADKVTAIPVVGEKLKPVVDQVIGKLNSFQ